jgi:hypothetical protein
MAHLHAKTSLQGCDTSCPLSPKGLKIAELPDRRYLFIRLRLADNQITGFKSIIPF